MVFGASRPRHRGLQRGRSEHSGYVGICAIRRCHGNREPATNGLQIFERFSPSAACTRSVSSLHAKSPTKSGSRERPAGIG